MTTTTTTTAMAMSSSSSLHIFRSGCNSSPFVALQGACLPLRGFGVVYPRFRQRMGYVRTVNAFASEFCRMRSENIIFVIARHLYTGAFVVSGSQRQKVRGCHIPRASYEDDNYENDNGLPEDAIPDGPIYEPEYYSYTDPNTGEPAPTYGERTPLPDRQFWNEDMIDITRSTQAASPFETSRVDLNEPLDKRRKAGGRRRKNDSTLPPTEAQMARAKKEETENEALLQSLKEKFNNDDEGEENEMRSADSYDEDEDEEEEEEEEGEEDPEVFDKTGKSLQEPTVALATVEKGDGDLTELLTPLTNDELWWNWRKPPPDQKPWSAWQKRAGDADTVMAAAMAETGQIELFGAKPTIAEATLARARKRVFYAERMEAEEARKKEIGAMAYYKEWVKNYDEDVSKEAVQRRYEETGEEEGIQLLEMFSHQTRDEYRIMQGTDIRIRRDPLTMRMREEQIKQVWGGDPVYPTVNYERDPDEVADYRNPNMHEPIPDIVEMLRESGRLITQEEVKRLQDFEKAQDLEFAEDDMLSGAVDIGDDDEENDDEDDEEDERGDERPLVKSVAVKSSQGNKSEPKQGAFTHDVDDESKVEATDDDVDDDVDDEEEQEEDEEQ